MPGKAWAQAGGALWRAQIVRNAGLAPVRSSKPSPGALSAALVLRKIRASKSRKALGYRNPGLCLLGSAPVGRNGACLSASVAHGTRWMSSGPQGRIGRVATAIRPGGPATLHRRLCHPSGVWSSPEPFLPPRGTFLLGLKPKPGPGSAGSGFWTILRRWSFGSNRALRWLPRNLKGLGRPCAAGVRPANSGRPF